MVRKKAVTSRAVLALALAMAVAACGSGGDVATDSSSTETSPVPTTTGSTDTGATSEPSPTTSGTTGSSATEPSSTGSPSTGPTTGSVSTTSAAPEAVALDRVAIRAIEVGRFAFPTALTPFRGGTAFLAEKSGRVRTFPEGRLVLDIGDDVIDEGERGLLGVAVSPGGDRLYVHYSDADSGGDTIVDEFGLSGTTVETSSRRRILRVDQPYANHNGGDLQFGPDGMLWLGLGDGGSGGDPHGHGQNPGTLLGSILRIDPSRPTDARAYGIPPDNPFVGGGGRPEVWLYGVRNPWRFHFDPGTGDLYVADVGQNQWEEISLLRAASGRGRGANLGWNLREGTHEFAGDRPPGAVDPIFEYDHDEGCSISGGVVYRGSAVTGLAGAYLFGDYCASSVRAIRVERGRVVDHATYDLDLDGVLAFGTDPDGEVLVLTTAAGGTVFRLAPR